MDTKALSGRKVTDGNYSHRHKSSALPDKTHGPDVDDAQDLRLLQQRLAKRNRRIMHGYGQENRRRRKGVTSAQY